MLACLNETLRCYPPFVTGAPRYTTKDVIIDGNLVPKGVSTIKMKTLVSYVNKSFLRRSERL